LSELVFAWRQFQLLLVYWLLHELFVRIANRGLFCSLTTLWGNLELNWCCFCWDWSQVWMTEYLEWKFMN
jgi:hypothetical protein